MRADARRNYELLLSAADAVFRAQGTAASLEHIARAAGVAIGTLYGHFPNRTALIGALLRERNDTLFATGDALADDTAGGASPVAAVRAWAAAVADHAATYSGLAEYLAEGAGDAASELHESCARLARISDRLVQVARAAGELRPDVTGADLLDLVNAVAWTREHATARRADRLLEFGLNGLLGRS